MYLEIYGGVFLAYYARLYAKHPRHRGESIVYALCWPVFLPLDVVFIEAGLLCLAAVGSILHAPAKWLDEKLAP